MIVDVDLIAFNCVFSIAVTLNHCSVWFGFGFGFKHLIADCSLMGGSLSSQRLLSPQQAQRAGTRLRKD